LAKKIYLLANLDFNPYSYPNMRNKPFSQDKLLVVTYISFAHLLRTKGYINLVDYQIMHYEGVYYSHRKSAVIVAPIVS